MKETIQELLNQSLENAQFEDLQVLEQLLKGFLNSKKDPDRPLISHLLNMERIIEEESSYITIPANSLTDNSFQIVHGGITATVLDTAMGTLANQLLPKGYGAVTSNLTIHYIAPGIGETVKASAKLIHKGSNTLVMEGSVYRDDGKKMAHGTGSFFIVPTAKDDNN
jgi:uncharacterized protein (TIGR00369 family)